MVQRSAIELTSALGSGFVTRAVNQNPAHSFRSSSEEVATTVPTFAFLSSDQAEVGLMDQSRGLQCLTRFFLREPAGRQFPELFVDQGEQLRRGRGVPLFDRREDASDVVHQESA